jgi:hypothetical protein
LTLLGCCSLGGLGVQYEGCLAFTFMVTEGVHCEVCDDVMDCDGSCLRSGIVYCGLIALSAWLMLVIPHMPSLLVRFLDELSPAHNSDAAPQRDDTLLCFSWTYVVLCHVFALPLRSAPVSAADFSTSTRTPSSRGSSVQTKRDNRKQRTGLPQHGTRNGTFGVAIHMSQNPSLQGSGSDMG